MRDVLQGPRSLGAYERNMAEMTFSDSLERVNAIMPPPDKEIKQLERRYTCVYCGAPIASRKEFCDPNCEDEFLKVENEGSREI